MKYCTECACAEETYVGSEKILTCYIARYKDVFDLEACESFRPKDSEDEDDTIHQHCVTLRNDT